MKTCNRYYVRPYNHQWAIRDRAQRDKDPDGAIVESFPGNSAGYTAAKDSCAVWNAAGDNTQIPCRKGGRRPKVPARVVQAALAQNGAGHLPVPITHLVPVPALTTTRRGPRPGSKRGPYNKGKRVQVVPDETRGCYMLIDTHKGKMIGKPYRKEEQAKAIAQQMNNLLK